MMRWEEALYKGGRGKWASMSRRAHVGRLPRARDGQVLDQQDAREVGARLQHRAQVLDQQEALAATGLQPRARLLKEAAREDAAAVVLCRVLGRGTAAKVHRTEPRLEPVKLGPGNRLA